MITPYFDTYFNVDLFFVFNKSVPYIFFPLLRGQVRTGESHFVRTKGLCPT